MDPDHMLRQILGGQENSNPAVSPMVEMVKDLGEAYAAFYMSQIATGMPRRAAFIATQNFMKLQWSLVIAQGTPPCRCDN